MKTSFVNKRSELTHEKELAEFCSMEVYRTRLHCNCKPEFNRRYGILIVDDNNCIIEKVIRCKSCTSTGSATDAANVNNGGQA